MNKTIKMRRTLEALAAEATRLGGYRADGLWHLADGMVTVSPSRVGVLVAGIGLVEVDELEGIVAAARLRASATGVGMLMRGSRPMRLTTTDQRLYGGAPTILDHLQRRSVRGHGVFLWADSYVPRREVADALESIVGADPRTQAVLAPSWRGTQVIVTRVPEIAKLARRGVRWPVTEAERTELDGIHAWLAQASDTDVLARLAELSPRTVGQRRQRGIDTGVWA